MKTIFRKSISLMLVFAMLFSLSTTAFAASNSPYIEGNPENVVITLKQLKDSTYQVTIRNDRDTAIGEWKLSFKTNFKLSEPDGASWSIAKNNTYSFWDADNGNIASGDSFSFTVVSDKKKNSEIHNVVFDYKDVDETDVCIVTFDYNYVGSPAAEVLKVKAGQRVNPLVNPQRDGCLFAGWYTDTEYVNKFDLSSPIYYNTYVYAKWVDFNSDIDEDGISNYDEVNVYGTDLDNPDTDGDGVPDGSELKLGIDPLNSIDGDEFFIQSLSEKEIAFNTENDYYGISVEFNAQNCIEDFLIVKSSPYSVMLKENRAIIGIPVDIEYFAGEIKSGEVRFRLDENFVNSRPDYFPNHKSGFDRFGVLYFDTEMHTLIPLECEYDESNFSIIISSDNIGNLVLIDYEAMMYDLGIEPTEKEPSVLYSMSVASAEPVFNSYSDDEVENSCQYYKLADNDFENVSEYDGTGFEENLSLAGNSNLLTEEFDYITAPFEEKEVLFAADNTDKTMRQVDLVLMIDATGSMGSAISNVKSNIVQLIQKLRDDSISLYVSIISFRDITYDGVNSTKVNLDNKSEFLNSTTDMYNVVNSLAATGGGDIPETDLDALGRAARLTYRSSAQKYAFLITDTGYKINNNYGYTSLEEVALDLAEKGVTVGVVSGNSSYKTLLNLTGGSQFGLSGNFCDGIYNLIKDSTPKEFVLIGNSLVTGSFKEPLVYGGSCDTDSDLLTDSKEVDWTYINLDKGTGEYELYTWEELCKKWLGLGRYGYSDKNPYYESLKGIMIIPAFSNPFNADTDGDYYPDKIDDDRLAAKPMYVYDSSLYDGYNLGVAPVYSEPSEYTDCVICASESVAPFSTKEYVFERNSGRAEFVLKPDRLSYYQVSGSSGAKIEVYKKGNLFGKDTLVAPQSDGSYLLSEGKQYIIVSNCNAPDKYSVKIRQDNWASIPEGGIWERSSVTSAFADPATMPSRVLYITEDKLTKALYEHTTANGKYRTLLVDSLEDVANILPQDQFKQFVEDYEAACGDGAKLKALIIEVGTASVGAGVTIVGWMVEAKVVAGSAAAVAAGIAGPVGAVITVVSVFSAAGHVMTFVDQCDFADAAVNGESNVQYNMYALSIYNNYEAWNENRGYAPKICLGNPGTVRELTVKDVKSYCGFK